MLVRKNSESIGGIVMAHFRGVKVLIQISTMLLVFVISLGCAQRNKDTKSSKTSEPVATLEDKASAPLYYDFEDVLVPSELKVDTRKSFVHHAPDFRAGVLVLTGRVEINSLIRFFENNMAKDNWRLKTYFRSPRTMLIFEKPNRDCVINITEKQFNTEVEIWVAPSGETAEGHLLK